MFENPVSQKHFQAVALQDGREENPSILDHAPLIRGLVTHSEGRALSPQFSLNDSWKENAIQLNTLRWWTFITQLISPADVYPQLWDVKYWAISSHLSLATEHRTGKISQAQESGVRMDGII